MASNTNINFTDFQTIVPAAWLNNVNLFVNDFALSNIAALRATTTSLQFGQALVQGYYTPGDGGGGLYFYNPTDHSSADNGGTIIVSADGGRWYMKQPPNLTPDMFGAKGDGITDDSAAINACVAAIGAQGGGRMIIPSKTYLCNSQITINHVNVSVMGADRHTSRLQFSNSNGLVFEVTQPGVSTDYQGLNVQELTILTTNTTQTGAAIGHYAIGYLPDLSNTGNPYPSIRVRGVEIRGVNGFLPQFWNTGIYINMGTNAIIDDVVMLGGFNWEYMSYGVYADNLSISTQVTNSQFSYMGTGIIQYSNDPDSTGSEGLQIIGCEMVLCGVGISKNNGTSPFARPLCLVTGCFINATATAIQCSNTTETVIVGNDLWVQDGVFVPVAPGASVISVANPSNNSNGWHTITGNTLRTLAGTTQVFGVVMNGVDGIISDNTMDRFQYGIILQTNARNIAVGPNMFSNTITAQIQNQGTGNGSWYTAKTTLPDNSSFNIF